MSGHDPISPEMRARLEAAMSEPMTDDEAIGLIVQLHTLAVDIMDMAPPDDAEFPLMMVRATNMVNHVADRLGVKVEREDEVHGRH